jgi:hypothetical protein
MLKKGSIEAKQKMERVRNHKKGKGFVDSIINGRSDLSPKVKNILSKCGDEIINHLEIQRVPLSKPLMLALNAFSLGQFDKNNPYDKLFHLRLSITTYLGNYTLEKNESINMTCSKPQSFEGTETMKVPISKITINELIDNTRKYMGAEFIPYSIHNNCQNFVLGVLKGNQLDTPENVAFTKQNVEDIFKNMPDYVRKLANTITDIAGRADVVVQGGKLKRV